MNITRMLAALTLGSVVAAGAAQAAPAADSWDGLVRVRAQSQDEAYLLPGADFSGYRAILLEPVGVSFRRHWLRDVNATRGQQRLSATDMASLGADMAALLHRSLAAELGRGGWKLVDAPGEDVLRVRATLRDLDVTAPDPQGLPGRKVYIMQAGESRLVLELADGATGQLLGRSVDRRRAGDEGYLRWATDAVNRDEFRQMFDRWSKTCVRALGRIVRGEVEAAAP